MTYASYSVGTMMPTSTTVALLRIHNPESYLQTHYDGLCHRGGAQ
jgi:hypothetical protein